MIELDPTEDKETEKQKDKKTFCYECEEAKRHTEKVKNHWFRKIGIPYWVILMGFLVGLFLSGVGWLTIIIDDENVREGGMVFAFFGIVVLLISVVTLASRLYQEICRGFSLYYFKTEDGVSHAHLRKPSMKIIHNLPIHLVVKIGVCGWFRKSRLLSYVYTGTDLQAKPITENGTLYFYDLSNNYNGLKIRKACCDKTTLELKGITPKNQHGDRITFVCLSEFFEYLESEDSRFEISMLPIRVCALRKLGIKLQNCVKAKEEELKTAREELEKHKDELVDMGEVLDLHDLTETGGRDAQVATLKRVMRKYKFGYETCLDFLQDLLGFLKDSKTNPNLGKSKHAQELKWRIKTFLKYDLPNATEIKKDEDENVPF